jgi:hypothetical protein
VPVLEDVKECWHREGHQAESVEEEEGGGVFRMSVVSRMIGRI